MKLIVRFAPFVVFTVLSAVVSWRVGVVGALVALLAQVALTPPHRFGILSGGMAVFFGAASVVALVAPTHGVEVALHPVAAAWLAIVSFGSIALGKPFTLEVASVGQQPEVLASPTFLAVNNAIAARWAWTFAAMAAVSTIAAITGATLLAPIFTVVALVAAAKYSTAYPERVLAEHAASPAA